EANMHHRSLDEQYTQVGPEAAKRYHEGRSLAKPLGRLRCEGAQHYWLQTYHFACSVIRKRIADFGRQELPEQHRRLCVYDDRLPLSPAPGRQLLEQRGLPSFVYQAQMGTSHDNCLDGHPPPRLQVGELRQRESRLTQGIFGAVPREQK